MTKRDPRKYNMGTCKEDYQSQLTLYSYQISDPSFDFVHFNRFSKGKRITYSHNVPACDFALRKANDNLKRIYSVKPNSRDTVIGQLKTVLQESMPLYIYKLDVESFYENINKESAFEKIFESNIVSYHTKKILRKYLESPDCKESEGLLRGMDVSATVSEIYMEEFDKSILKMPAIYFYARYVDDIIIITYKKVDNIILEFSNKLPAGLSFNTSKTSTEDLTQIPKKKSIEVKYLGYSFSIFGAKGDGYRKIEINISENKIKKIKTRIINALIDYNLHKNIDLFEKRIQFLTGNFYILSRKNKKKIEHENGGLKSGIYFNFKFLNNDKQLEDLDNFLNKSLLCRRGSLAKFSKSISNSNRKKILLYSFKSGFHCQRTHNFTDHELKDICRCWND